MIILCLGLSSCGTTGSSPPEPSPSQSVSEPSSKRLPFSIASFQVCYPIQKIDEIETTLTRVEDGLLSKQDLEEGLSSLSYASELATALMQETDYYERFPETEDILPKNLLPEYSERTKAEGIWFAKVRVKLIDQKIIDIVDLKSRLDNYRAYLDSFCAGYSND